MIIAEESLLAEAWGLLHGLAMCWNLGLRKNEVESDELQMIQKLGNNKRQHCSAEPWKTLEAMMSRDWQISLKHIYREGNRSAHELAAMSISQQEERIVCLTPPERMLK